MTFDDDMVRLHLTVGSPTIPLVKLGLTWPPPERLYIGEDGVIRAATPDDDERYVMQRVSHSQLTDSQRATMTNVFRGAEYEYQLK